MKRAMPLTFLLISCAKLLQMCNIRKYAGVFLKISKIMKMPMMTAKCICFAGNNVGSKVFRDKVNDADMEGNLLHQYDTIMDFFTRNLHNV